MLAAPLLKPTDKHDDNTIYEAMKKLRYPVIASLKMDGVRALMTEKGLVSRRLKLIPNDQLRSQAREYLKLGDDMELWSPLLPYNDIQSIVMSEKHENSLMINFLLIDNFSFCLPYSKRLEMLKGRSNEPEIHWCFSATELFEKERLFIDNLGEGICFRIPDSPYKNGRSTLKEQYLVKLCRSVTDECTIIGFGEALENQNTKELDSLGLTKRASFNAYFIGKDTLGFIKVQNKNGLEFSIGTGFDNKLRKQIWDNKDEYMGKQLTYKSKAHGIKNKPRCPSFVGFREKGF